MIFPVPNTILTLSKDQKILFALNLIMFAVGLIFIIIPPPVVAKG